MGCSASRPEAGEDIPPGLRPFLRRMQELRRSRTEDMRRRRRERKDSIVSTAELLRPEDRDADDCYAVVEPEAKERDNWKAAEVPSVGDSTPLPEEEGRRIVHGRERREGLATALEEEMPGSPSFRIFFSDTDQARSCDTQTGDAAQTNSQEKPDEIKQVISGMEEHNDCLSSGEESDLKELKKEKGRRFMTLPKSHFLNVRGCYSTNSHSLHSQEGHQALTEKTT